MRFKFLSALIVLVLAFVVFPAGPSQASAASSGTCGDNLTWTLDDTGTLTISGTGDMYDWNYIGYKRNPPWKGNNSLIKRVVIENGVTSIGKCAFCNDYGGDYKNLSSVAISQSVTEIKEEAFRSCKAIKNVRISGNVHTIEKYAFYETGLTNLILENGIMRIEHGAFDGSQLTSVNIPESVEYIAAYELGGNSAFSNKVAFDVDPNNRFYCIDSTGVLFDKTKETLIQYPSICTSTTYDVPSSVIKIEDGAFRENSYLKTVVLPRGVEDLGGGVFDDCRNLTSLTLPNSLKHIGRWTAYDSFDKISNTTYMKKENGVYYIGNNLIFCDYTKNLVYTSASLQEYTNKIKVKDGTICVADYAFSWMNGEKLSELQLPESAIYLGKGMLKNCKNLQKISLPNGISEIPDDMFSECEKLSEVSIPSGVKKIGRYAFSGCALSDITIPNSVEEIGENAFSYNYVLKNVSLASSGKLHTIGGRAFAYCETLSSINLTEGITKIGYDAFLQCQALQSIVVPSTVMSLGSAAFLGCISLENIDYRAVEATNMSDSYGVFSYAGNASNGVSVSFSNTVKSIPSNLFGGDVAANVTAISLGVNIETIGESAFQNCKNFSAITIPSSLQSIGAKAFSGCTGLKEVYFNGVAPETASDSFGTVEQMNATTIYYGSVAESSFNTPYWNQFQKMISLTGGICGKTANWHLRDGTLTIDGSGPMYGYDSSDKTPWHEYANEITSVYFQGISQIGAYAFSDLPNLQTAELVTNEAGTGNLTSIGMFAFSNCDALKKIILPDTVVTLGNFAFYGCDHLESASLGSGIQKIGTAAFYDCVNLKNVYCFTKAPSVGTNAFKNCPESLIVRYPMGAPGWPTPSTPDGPTTKWNGVTSEPMQVSSIAVSRPPVMVPYETGSALNTQGLILLATYDTGNDDISYSSTVTSDFDLEYDFSTAGEQEVTVQYAGCTTNFSVNVVEPTVTEVEILELPEVMTYEVGDELVTDGLVLQVTYSNNEIVQLTDGYTTEYAFNQEGEARVIVRFGEAAAVFSVTVSEPKLAGISIVTPPTTVRYPLNGVLDPTGLEILGKYSNETTQTIPAAQCQFTYDFSSPGEKTVTVSYQNFSATFPVTVQGADWPIVSLVTEEAVRGREMTVSVKIEKNTGLGNYTFRLLYDTASLDFVSYQSDYEGTGRQNYKVNGVLKGQKLQFMADDAITGDGVLATFTFKVAETAPIGEQAITLVVDEATDANGDTRDLYPMSGTICVLERLPGDGNGDGVVRVDDALMVIQYVTGQSSLTEAERAALDVNGDGAVTLADAVKILRAVVGLSGS